MATPRLRLGQLLVDARMLTQDALDEVLAVQKVDGRRLGALLVERKQINETQLTQILSHQLSIPWVSLLHIEFSRQLLNLVPHNVAEKYCLVPIYVRHVRGQGETLYVAMDDPSNEEGLRECTTFSGLPVRAMIAPPTDIQNAIRVYYGGGPPKPAAPPPAQIAPPTQRLGQAPPTQLSAELPEAPPRPPIAPPAAASVTTPQGMEPLAPPARTEETPAIEAHEIQVNPKASGRLQRFIDGSAEVAPSSERAVPSIPTPKGRAPRMVALTLLDGTTINLPAKARAARPDSAARRVPEAPKTEPRADGAAPEEEGAQLTARDLVAALRAVAHGADASEILGDHPSWEAMFSALLSLLLKKHLIADWEFVDEFTAAGGVRRSSILPSGEGSGSGV